MFLELFSENKWSASVLEYSLQKPRLLNTELGSLETSDFINAL